MMARYEPRRAAWCPQGISAEMIADRWGLSRADLDAFGARSQQRAQAATEEGRFEREIVPVAVKVRDKESGQVLEPDEMLGRDEGIRPDTTVETLANLKPAFKPERGKVTAGNSSQITDGASAALIMSEERPPRPRLHPPGPLPQLRPGRRRPRHSC